MASSTPTPEVSDPAFAGAESSDNPNTTVNHHDTEEEALESHEVIELQAFSERKAWIEEKIKFLKLLPPIQVFVGVDALRTSAASVPGLPSREQLKEWLAEHDRIEKDTEVFDSGELKKLRKFTKAATQRHLSPEDTDLIELTLTTICELDKLLHLLRDRSENLDLLAVRLTWEEHRTAAWAELKKLMADIETFLVTRARWSPSIYEVMPKHEERATARRGSIASMASDTSVTSNAGFSRTARFKLAELLSRDAAQFAGKASSLRHGKIAAAGKALDKLIDHSRKPVPEELLDEQDRLEDKGINEMEDVGKFVMDIVTQWRKADELYVETIKDQNSAQNLLEEIETAKIYHPMARQSSSFTSRVDTLLKRLPLRGDPVASSSFFPRPTHPLFPDQLSFNPSLVQSLSAEFATATELVTKVDALAKEYRSGYEAVKEIDIHSQSANEMLSKLNSITDRLVHGLSASDGDGSPPDLTSEICLQPTTHAIFLALLPALLEEAEQVNSAAEKLVCTYQLALLNLDRPGIDIAFKQNAINQLDVLVAARDRSRVVVADTTARVGRLRVVRRVWSSMDEALKELQNIQSELGETMEKERWRSRVDTGADPMTPETPRSQALDPIIPTSDVLKRLDNVRRALSDDIAVPLASLSGSLEAPLDTFLTQACDGLTSRLTNAKQMVHLLDAIRAQSAAMGSLREEVNELQVRIEDLRIRYDAAIEEALSGDLPLERIPELHTELQSDANSLADAVKALAASVTRRVPFVSPTPRDQTSTTFIRRKYSSGDLRLGVSHLSVPIELPFSLNTLDDSVRADSNSLVIRLTGELESLQRKSDHFQLAHMAKTVDIATSFATTDVREVTQELESLRSALSSLPEGDSKLARLQELSQDVGKHYSIHRSRLSRSLSLIRESLRQMESMPAAHDFSLHDSMVSSRRRAVDDLEIKVNSWGDRTGLLRNEVSNALLLESRRLEALRMQREQEEAEKRQREERERAEEAARREAERLGVERRERERVAEENRQHEKRQRAEEAARLEAERLEAERRERERVAEEKRQQEERERAEEAARLEAERLEAERRERERVAEEKRQQEERERAEEAARLEAERLEAERRERERVAEEKRQQEERERTEEAARLEAERLEAEQREREQLAREEAEKRARELAKREEAERRLRDQEQRELREASLRTLERQEEEALHKMHTLLESEEHERLEAEQAPGLQTAIGPEDDLVDEKAAGSSVRAVFATPAPSVLPDEDVFGLRVAPSPSPTKSQGKDEVLEKIVALRKRLRSISINEVARPFSTSSFATQLPTLEKYGKMNATFSGVLSAFAALPTTALQPAADLEYRSLKTEIDASQEFMQRIRRSADLADTAHKCDLALSDLLEHIDSYPAAPAGPLSSTHISTPRLPPEEQLSARIGFTRRMFAQVTTYLGPVSDDPRAVAEHQRIQQTWAELEEMANDRIGGRRSRPSSVVSSGRNSRSSLSGISSNSGGSRPPGPRPSHGRKSSGYSSLSVSGSGKGQFLTPTQSSSRRVFSGSTETHRRSSSKLSMVSADTSRSVSGPIATSSPSLSASVHGSTFASRQRTASLSSTISSPAPQSTLTVRPRAQTRSRVSPTPSDMSSTSRTNPARSSSSMSTWSRAPRQSFPTANRAQTPPRRTQPTSKTAYVANPTNKLDVAVGDVVNKLPVNINVEVVADTWKDQSGKYWIGDQEPKLCFCRILRSQTVMVRVGGGWQELSKFIKDHFADMFRIMPPDSPPPFSSPRFGSKEEMWISSTTLFEAPEIITSPPPPRTPEPRGPFIPSFTLSTPGAANSPHSAKSTPSSGSPLAPLQFMRRANPDGPAIRPVTPSKPPTHRPRASIPSTPARHAWRP